ncbi:acyltransferase [Helcobacillus sp. ACRRO]|uniref:acyltransferase n=1 Tax=Helcobacillus sp. ACRRO TaxID=2918202 RepID=UPI001EF6A971|nr:acyltransferase [Helcobacillus sp. ACRRO]MCG7427388.1 acyltransferase [Helcobacillus sp. ACRRO]
MARAASATAPTRAARPYIPFLDAMRVIAIIAVLGIHAIAPAYTAESVGWPTALLRSALGPAVPVFVMMSGALNLTEGAHRRGTAAFLRTRFLRLLPAALAWSALYMLVVQPLLWGTELTGKGLIRQAIRADAAPHLYFLWVVLGLSLLSPVLAPFVERSAGHAYALAAAGVAWTPLTAVAAGLPRHVLAGGGRGPTPPAAARQRLLRRVPGAHGVRGGASHLVPGAGVGGAGPEPRGVGARGGPVVRADAGVDPHPGAAPLRLNRVRLTASPTSRS